MLVVIGCDSGDAPQEIIFHAMWVYHSRTRCRLVAAGSPISGTPAVIEDIRPEVVTGRHHYGRRHAAGGGASDRPYSRLH